MPRWRAAHQLIAIDANKIRIAEATLGRGPVLFSTRPQITPGKATEYGRRAGIRALALQRVEDFLDLIHAPTRS